MNQENSLPATVSTRHNSLPATVSTRHNFVTPSTHYYFDIFPSRHTYVFPGLAAYYMQYTSSAFIETRCVLSYTIAQQQQQQQQQQLHFEKLYNFLKIYLESF
jgi:hypothetical protein